MEDLERSAWNLLCESLVQLRAITREDLDTTLYGNFNTPAAKLLRQIRNWGSLRFRQGVALSEKLDEAEAVTSTDWRVP